MKPIKLLSLLGAGALVLAALPASAQFSDYLAMFDRNGNFIPGLITSSTEPGETPNQLKLLDSGSASQLASSTGNYIAIYEPDGVTLSDVVGIINSFGQNTFAYVSDPLGNFGNFGFTRQVGTAVEGPGGILLILSGPAWVNQNNPQVAGGSAHFFSDGNPDGGLTVALLGFALVGVEGLRRKLRK